MRERPIILTGDEVRAVLAGATQLRRVVKPQPDEGIDELHGWQLRKRAPYQLEDDEGFIVGHGFQDEQTFYKCPFGRPGDLLWVKESWYDDLHARTPSDGRVEIYYRADGEACEQFEDHSGLKWRSAVQMPRWASRLTLRINGVRVEQHDGKWHWVLDVENYRAGWREGVRDE